VSGARLTDALGDKLREDGDVQDIAGVDKGARSRCRKLCKARDSLLRGDKGTVDVDIRVATEVGQGEAEGVVGGGEVHGAGCDASVDRRRHCGGRGLTIVDDNTGDAEHLLHFGKGIDYAVGVGEVARDVQLVVGAVGLLQRAGGEGDLVALGGKGAGDGLADIGASTEDKDDGRFGGHDLYSMNLQINLCVVSNVL
jgi:hypothetical protein